MILMVALSLASAVTTGSPARRVDPDAQSSFTATVRILRGAGIGQGHKPSDAQMRETTLTDAAGQAHPAIVYDFE
jgi:hypothetical protein